MDWTGASRGREQVQWKFGSWRPCCWRGASQTSGAARPCASSPPGCKGSTNWHQGGLPAPPVAAIATLAASFASPAGQITPHRATEPPATPRSIVDRHEAQQQNLPPPHLVHDALADELNGDHVVIALVAAEVHEAQRARVDALELLIDCMSVFAYGLQVRAWRQAHRAAQSDGGDQGPGREARRLIKVRIGQRSGTQGRWGRERCRPPLAPSRQPPSPEVAGRALVSGG